MRHNRRLTAISLVLGVTAASTAWLPGATAAAVPAAAGWGRVVNLSRTAPLGTLVPTSAAVDARGNMLAVWVHTDGSGAPLMAAYRHAGRRWTTRAVPGSRGASDADLAFDRAGDAVVVWTAGRRVRATRRAGGRWAKPVTVAIARAGVEPRPPNSVQLAVNPRGRALALWEGRRGPRAAIGFRNGTWGRPTTLFAGSHSMRAESQRSSSAAPMSSSGDTNVVMDRKGRATVALARGGFAAQPFVVSRDPGKAWSKPHALAPLSLGNGSEQIAGKRNGDLAVAWESTVRGTTGIRVARKTRQGGWLQTPPLVQGMDTLKLRIAMDGSGVVTAVWLTDRGALWRAAQSPGGRWTRKVRVMPPGTAGDEYGLVANDAGNVLLGSTAPPGAHPVWALRRSPVNAWQAHPVTVSRGRGEARGPAVAIGPSGAALMVWALQPRGSALSRVQASSVTP